MQVIGNLLTNAFKFTTEGTIELGYYTPDNEKICFFVRHTGIGIPLNKHEEIFNRFVKLDSFKQGTGLGLSICQIIADKIGGKIGLKSEVGKGSEFWFEIPYKPSNLQI